MSRCLTGIYNKGTCTVQSKQQDVLCRHIGGVSIMLNAYQLSHHYILYIFTYALIIIIITPLSSNSQVDIDHWFGTLGFDENCVAPFFSKKKHTVLLADTNLWKIIL